MELREYKDLDAREIPVPDSNPLEEPPSTASDSDHLLQQDLELQEVRPGGRLSKWRRLLLSRVWSTGRRSHTISSDEGLCGHCEKTKVTKKTLLRTCAYIGLWIFASFGALALLNLWIGLAPSFPSDGIHRIIRLWGQSGQLGDGLSSWPTDFSRGIFPIPCHSHNDYWQKVPLYSAIEAGCMSVEADIWLIDEELYVGHDRASLTNDRTLASLYINPLLDILSYQNPTTSFYPDGNASLRGVFDTTTQQSLVLIIDFKTPGAELWPYVLSALKPFRERHYLTHHDGTRIIDGPITVVGSGNTPFELISSNSTNPHLDVFFDAPLDQMWAGKDTQQAPTNFSSEEISKSMHPNLYNSLNSYYASTSFVDAVGYPWQGQVTDQQLSLIRGQLAGAHAKGLKARYWDLPSWPIGLRDHVWDVLVKEGIDLLNVDDLAAATQQKWT